MREIRGDIWEQPADAIVIPINWTTRSDGTAVMGAGVAKQAAARFPRLSFHLGRCIRQHPDLPHVLAFPVRDDLDVACFPTKRHWRGKSRIEDVRVGLEDFVVQVKERRIASVAMPALGCGLGGLRWEDVRPLIVAACEAIPEVRVRLYR